MKPIFNLAPEKYAPERQIVPDYAVYHNQNPIYSVAIDDTYEGRVKKIYDRAKKVFARSQDRSVQNGGETSLTDGVMIFKSQCKADDVAELAYLCTLGTAYDSHVFSGKRELENLWRGAFDSFVGNTMKKGSAIVGDIFQIPDESEATYKNMRIMRNMCYQAMEQGAEKALTHHGANGLQTNKRMRRMARFISNVLESHHIPWNPPAPPKKNKTKSTPAA